MVIELDVETDDRSVLRRGDRVLCREPAFYERQGLRPRYIAMTSQYSSRQRPRLLRCARYLSP